MTPNDLGTWEWMVSELVRGRLLERGQLDPLLAEFRDAQPYGDALALSQFLVEKGLLTPFQAGRAREGEARKLVLGPYVLVDLVGNGNMGSVYRAVGRADKLAYAVKVLPLRSLWNVRLARKQVRAFADLPAHPVVVPFLDVGTAIGVHYLVWPFVEGQTLEGRVAAGGPLPIPELSRIGAQIAEGLRTAGTRGLFHGLLKPSNVSLGADGQVRLLDFGIGALLAENIDEEESLIDTISTANATSGMLDCSSPESIVDPTKRTLAGDQYALGCTLFYAATGQYPFPDGNVVEKMMAHQSQTPPDVRSLRADAPSGLAGVIERLMQKSPEQRFGNLDELIDLLAPLSQGNSSGVIPRARQMAELREKAMAAATLKPPVEAPPASVRAPAPAAPAQPPVRPAQPATPQRPAAPVQPAAQRPAVPAQPARPAATAQPAAQRPAAPQRPAPARPDPALHPASLTPDQLQAAADLPPARKPPVTPAGRANLVDSTDDFDSQQLPIPGMAPLPPTPPAARRPANPARPGAPAPAAPLPPPPAAPVGPIRIDLPPVPAPGFLSKLMFWKPKLSTVQISVFAAERVRAGETLPVLVVTHPPEMTQSVIDYARQVNPHCQAVGAAYVARGLPAEATLELFLGVTSAQTAEALKPVKWTGRPAVVQFVIQIDPRAVGAELPGAISVGQSSVLIGQIPVRFLLG